MNEEIPLRKLREILSLYGTAVLNDPRRLASLMRDFFGEYKREIYILTTSLYNHIPDDLLTLDKTMPAEIGLSRMVERLINECAMSDEAARWGVQTWAQALGVIKHPILESHPRLNPLPLENKIPSPIKMPLPKPGQRAYSANTAKSTPTPLWILGAGSIILILLAGYILYRNFSTQKTNEINATPMPGNYELGMNALNQGDYPQAILNFTEAINAEPQNAAAYYNRGFAYKNKKQDLKALADYGEAIRLKPDYADAYLKRASLLDERGDLIGAANDYSQVIKLSPNLPDPYFQRGYIHYKQEDFSAAINDFSAVLNLDLKNDKAYYYRGIIYIDQNNLTSAIDDLSKAMKINPKDPGYSFQRGIAQAKSKNLDDALSDFTTSITLNPENPGSYYERGKIFAQKGDFNGATDDFTHVIKIGSSTPLTYYAYINRAFVRAQNGDSEGAVNDATHATEANPQDSEGWNSLCWLGSLTGRAQQVLSACDQAIALDPANGNYQDSRGLARALNGDRKGAIEDFNNFIAWSKANGESEQERNERTEWSKALQKGKNPFNEALLNDLMGRSNIFGVITPTPEALSGVELSTESSPPACKKSNIAWKSPKDNMPLVCVPAGEFSMGSKKDDPLSYPNEHPQHTVYLDAFWIDRTEITNQMYSRCVQASECKPPIKGSYQYNNASYVNHPVIVDWQSAQAYCQWVERRLPSEAEWEKAARGVDTLTYPWGNEITCQDANYAGCVGDSKPVGSYPDSASPYGALDMAGNVWEWVADWYDKGYYSNSPSINPQGPPSGERHILRGGAWDDSYDRNLRTTYRNGLDKDTTGFRCVLGPNFPKTTPP